MNRHHRPEMDSNPSSNSLPSPTTATSSSSSPALSVSVSSNAVFKLISNKNFFHRFFTNLNLSPRRLRFLRSISSNNNRLTRNGAVHPNSSSSKIELSEDDDDDDERGPIRIATFNASLFSMAPATAAVPSQDANNSLYVQSPRPLKSILKKSPLHPSAATSSSTTTTTTPNLRRPRVSINLPDNEITLLNQRRQSTTTRVNNEDQITANSPGNSSDSSSSSCCLGRELDRTVADVLRELNLDIISLQEVRAEEESEMKPLSDLANSLGMKHYVFAESWAPQFGNAVLSKWPIKRWRVKKIVDDSDFRNVLKTTIDIPGIGELNLYCTHLDHLDESWRMKQIQSIMIDSTTTPHILLGGLNALDNNDYSQQRWTDIVQYCEDVGKPSPKTEVINYLKKNKNYIDAKDFAGEFESVIIATKGQSVQGTCKYGTRVDYILASPDSPYKFVPGSYSVVSSKGTSDHHIVKVDLERVDRIRNIAWKKRQQQTKPR